MYERTLGNIALAVLPVGREMYLCRTQPTALVLTMLAAGNDGRLLTDREARRQDIMAALASRVLRDGSFCYHASSVRSADRVRVAPAIRSNGLAVHAARTFAR
jgi:hypothetical protein